METKQQCECGDVCFKCLDDVLDTNYQEIINGSEDVCDIEALYKMKLLLMTQLKQATPTTETMRTIEKLQNELVSLKLKLILKNKNREI
jgi:hypothetical protein